MTTMTETASGSTECGTAHLAGKYLTFGLADEIYGLEIQKVQEIIKLQDITKVPRTPHYVKGVINLRGKVIPVIDLRAKFEMPTVDATKRTCIVVAEVTHEAGDVTMGVVVDEVSEVLDVVSTDIELAPAMGLAVDTSFILGMAKSPDGVKILLDVNRVLSVTEVEEMKAIA